MSNRGKAIILPPATSCNSWTEYNVPYTLVLSPEVTTFDQMAIVEKSGTLDFWNMEKNLYSASDGNSV